MTKKAMQKFVEDIAETVVRASGLDVGEHRATVAQLKREHNAKLGRKVS